MYSGPIIFTVPQIHLPDNSPRLHLNLATRHRKPSRKGIQLSKTALDNQDSLNPSSPSLLAAKMGLLGKIIHLSVDAVIVSAFLAGVKRSTGLSFKTEKIESKDMRGMVNKYLDIGEWVMDQSIAVMGTSAYFERKSMSSAFSSRS
ncbi:hypothetical protein TWF569_004672 [Orbilia oligospora]|uniref:Uncharacterized protein n=1 Tax=Orbilia oligospora TaxID=2813651 RepID=A0A7C8PE92_ORBOL|nr:hypothetical protein TWF103_008726 [Orbilia oligospora]KAF3105372.1 hypothetical protein TWF102_002296 [Orbilia oligospora]KAF3115069.1 hypothetical protein TWF706_007193 [Orbilia oligospora]KAF3150194.1 hypothetical protein TWF594_010075 [Orbilia oligospora]KAF3150278.1 hypothetical protein TWF569_004672 [Orbilia oligospora]